MYCLRGVPYVVPVYRGRGDGGLVPRDWDLANRIKHQNLADAHAVGADIMVTLCPMCYANLRKRAPEHDLTVMILSDLCRAALGEVEIGGA